MSKFWPVAASSALVLFAWMVFANTLFRASIITVIGEGKISVAPEEASLIVTRVDSSPDVVTAVNTGEQQITTLLSVARSIAMDAQIQQSFYRVTPQVGGQYLVANAFSVKTKNVVQVDGLIEALYLGGATTISDVTFTTSNPAETEQEARLRAVADAKTKAKAIAKSANKRLGKLVSLQDDNAAPSSSLTSGSNIDLVKRVSVVYEIW